MIIVIQRCLTPCMRAASLHVGGSAVHKYCIRSRLLLSVSSFMGALVFLQTLLFSTSVVLVTDAPQLLLLAVCSQVSVLWSSCVSSAHLWSEASVLPASSFLQWALHTRTLWVFWSQTCVGHVQPNVTGMPWWVLLRWVYWLFSTLHTSGTLSCLWIPRVWRRCPSWVLVSIFMCLW